MTAAPKPAQRRRRKIPPAARAKFLDALAAGWSVRHASALTTHAFQRWYELRAADEEFAESWAQAVEQGTQMLEDEAYRRAVQGWDEPVYQQGELAGHVRKYDSGLLTFLLKGRQPEKYRDTAAVQLNANVRELHIAPDPDRMGRVLTTLRDVGVLTHVPVEKLLELTEGEGEGEGE